MAGSGKAPFWEGGGVQKRYTTPKGAISIQVGGRTWTGDLTELVAELGLRRRKAEGREESIEESEQSVLMIVLGGMVILACPACSAGIPCQLHCLRACGLERGSAKKKKPVAPNPSGEHKRIIELFDEKWTAMRGARPAWLLPKEPDAKAPREFAMIARALKTYGFDRIARAIEGAFAGYNPRGATIVEILANPDRYLPAPSAHRAAVGQSR